MNDIYMNPLVSVIMPTYNSSSFVEESIKSVITQTYKNWELIITDDCSDDDTFSVIRKFESLDNRIKVYKLDVNSGAAVARNNSIKYANGQFIAFLDSDDKWFPQKLEKQIEWMLKNDHSLTYTDYSIINENEEHLGFFYSPSKLSYDTMLKNDYIGFLTVVYDANKLGKHFMPSIRKRQDWALLLKMLKIIPFAYGLPEVLSIYKKREASISSKKYKLFKYIWSVYRETENMSFFRSLYYLFTYPFYYFKKQHNCFSKS